MQLSQASPTSEMLVMTSVGLLRFYLFKVRVFDRRIGKTSVVQNITIREDILQFATGKRQFEDDLLITKCIGPIP